jgi:hypothetical protein
VSEELLNQLLSQASPLDEGQLRLLMDMAAALSGDIEAWAGPDSDIATVAFASSFSNRLRLHHATNAQKLNKKAFEYAFEAASCAAGRTATIVSDPTNPGADVLVGGVPFSLKTEASASISQTKITISKLMEARWIRELHDSADCAAAMAHVGRHLANYDRVLVLRAHDVAGPAVRYELWEVYRLTASDFSGPNANGTATAKVQSDTGGVAFAIRLDGSVEKITVSGLNTSLCTLHGYWVVPTLASADE